MNTKLSFKKGDIFSYGEGYGKSRYTFVKMDRNDLIARCIEMRHQIFKFTPEQQKKIIRT